MASSLSWARGPQRGSEGRRATVYTCTWSMRPAAGHDLAHPLDPGARPRRRPALSPSSASSMAWITIGRSRATSSRLSRMRLEGQARAVHDLEVGFGARVELAPQLVERGEARPHLRSLWKSVAFVSSRSGTPGARRSRSSRTARAACGNSGGVVGSPSPAKAMSATRRSSGATLSNGGRAHRSPLRALAAAPRAPRRAPPRRSATARRGSSGPPGSRGSRSCRPCRGSG